jgi:hypothetical protein
MGALAESFTFLHPKSASECFAGRFTTVRVFTYYDTTYMIYDDKVLRRFFDRVPYFQLVMLLNAGRAAELKLTEAIPMSICEHVTHLSTPNCLAGRTNFRDVSLAECS